ncbi:MAG: serine/threonine protein kinase [Tannerella sp.]|nr:serine/threonine protein kinase [Tannerella sp.]
MQRILGRGGFSEVWLADDIMTSTKVALKFYAPSGGLDDEGIKVFIHEFALLFNLNHSNLLKPSHYDHYEKMPYLVLAYCENGSAQKLIDRIDERNAWRFLRDVSEGLHYLHSSNPPILHQDIKPDNILIDRNGRFVITDFGISIQIRRTLRKATTVATTGGTLAYMAPERFGSNPDPVKASDVYSLGATMFELLTGNVPFGEYGGLLQKNGAEIPVIKQKYSNKLKQLVYRCLALNTWDRPTAREISVCARKMLETNVEQGQVTIRDNGGSSHDGGSGHGDGGYDSSGGGYNGGSGGGGYDGDGHDDGIGADADGTGRSAGKIVIALVGGLIFAAFVIAAFFAADRISDSREKKKAVNLYNQYILQGDTLKGIGQEAVENFLMYVDALENYQLALKSAENLDDSLLKNNAREKIDNTKSLILKTRDEFLNTAEKMKNLDILPAAEAFTERANSLSERYEHVVINQ